MPLRIFLVTLLAGCASAPLFGPVQHVSGVRPAPMAAAHGTRVPASASRGDLLYVATGDDVYVLSYPQGKLVADLGVAGANICSDRLGNVYVPAETWFVDEYAHDGTLVRRFDVGYRTFACSVDPITANLAATFNTSYGSGVALFLNGNGPEEVHHDKKIGSYGLSAYDAAGRLYVAGTGPNASIGVLPEGRRIWRTYSLGGKFAQFGDLAWDGTAMTNTNPEKRRIYRFVRAGGSIRVVQTTAVSGWHAIYLGHWPFVQTYLDAHTFVAQTTSGAKIGVWRYPRGGNPLMTLGPFRPGPTTIYGVTISRATPSGTQ
jgi:hypothetical protein